MFFLDSLLSHLKLRKVCTELETHLDDYFSELNMSSGRFLLLAVLSTSSKGFMPSDLAQQLGVTQATISGLINGLEKEGLLQRLTHESDGRSYVIQLTVKGRDFVGRVLPDYHTRINKFWLKFTEQEKRQLNGFFDRMIEHMSIMSRNDAQ